MTRLILLILIISSLIAGSCSRRKKRLDHRNLIPEKELISILTDVQIANGLLSIPKVHTWFYSLDSISTYYYIIEKHGYSKETMDKTLRYYFIKNPKKLIKIYDQVLGILSEMESLAKKEELQVKERIGNLWTGKEFYSFPDPSGTDSTQFDITLNRSGLYTLVFSATLFPDDQSVNPRITAYTSHHDSIETGKRDYIETINYLKDGQSHINTLIVKVPKNNTLHLRGQLCDFDNHPAEWEKHMIIETISFTYNPAAR